MTASAQAWLRCRVEHPVCATVSDLLAAGVGFLVGWWAS